jgi:hypothetical protein
MILKIGATPFFFIYRIKDYGKDEMSLQVRL